MTDSGRHAWQLTCNHSQWHSKVLAGAACCPGFLPNLSTKELRRIEQLVKEHEDDFREAWDKHFGQ